MSDSYPSRRELRLQRQRAERAKLRDEEAQRWAAELEHRDVGVDQPEDTDLDDDRSDDTNLEASDSGEQAAVELQDSEPAAEAQEDPSDVEDTAALGRRASASPVDTPGEVEEAMAETEPGSRRRRRADSEVTSTGMLPIISKPRDEKAAERPRSRREMREVEARRAAERRAEAARLQRVQDTLAETRPARRATSPQTTPRSVPLPLTPVTAEPVPIKPQSAPSEEFEVTLGDGFTESAAEITDMSGLDTIEIRRAELRAETERLTQEIMKMGQANPNVIDPGMLRRQKELAQKSKELQDLETAAISLVEGSDQDPSQAADARPTEHAHEASDQAELIITSTATKAEETDEKSKKAADNTSKKPFDAKQTTAESTAKHSTRRRPRRAQSAPLITGPFDVDQHADHGNKPAPVPSAELLEELQRPSKVSSGEPVDATEAHGLDSLDARDFEAPERRMVLSSAIVFAIGIIALIIAIILLIR